MRSVDRVCAPLPQQSLAPSVARAHSLGDVSDDTEQPRGKGASTIEFFQSFVNHSERGLHDVLRLIPIADHLPREQRGGANVAAHEHAERRIVTGSRSRDQLAVGPLVIGQIAS